MQAGGERESQRSAIHYFNRTFTATKCKQGGAGVVSCMQPRGHYKHNRAARTPPYESLSYPQQ